MLNNTYFSNNASEFSLFHNNVRSLTLNHNKIEEIFQDCDKLPDILAITETRLNEDSVIPVFENYEFEFENAVYTENDMRGVGLYISDKIDYTIR